MAGNKIFSDQAIIEMQYQVFVRFNEKVNKLFLKMMARSKENLLKSDPLMIEMIGLLREFTTWYCKTTKAMMVQNDLKIPKVTKEDGN